MGAPPASGEGAQLGAGGMVGVGGAWVWTSGVWLWFWLWDGAGSGLLGSDRLGSTLTLADVFYVTAFT